jgi:flagella basal body P-ring formation protein FlgA
VRLGAIAEVSGDPKLAQRVGDIAVHRFDDGETRWQVSGRRVGQALWDAGVPLDAVELEIPIGARVARETARIGADEVRQRIRAVAEQRAEENERWRLAFPEGVSAIEGLKERGELRVELSPERGEARVRVVAGGEVAASRRLPVTVDRQRRVVVARKQLSAGSRLQAEDVTTAYRSVDGSRWQYLHDSSRAVGTWVLRAVGKDQPVRRAALRLPPDVRSGDPVSLVVRKGELQISTAGIVRRQAAVGEVIPVQNRDTNKRVFARLVDPSTAVVVDNRRAAIGHEGAGS